MKQDQRLSMYTVLYRSLSGSLTKDLLTKQLHQQHDHRPNIYMNYQGLSLTHNQVLVLKL